jgi:hypothetical protein
MAKKEEIQKKNVEEANEALGAQLNLVTSLQDKMSFLLKTYKEKGTLDKQSLDSVKAVVAATKNLKAEYDSVKEVQKDISKNQKLQQDIERQKNALFKQGGEDLKKELDIFQKQTKSLSDQQAKVAKMNSDKALGKKIDQTLYDQAVNTLTKKEEQLKISNESLSAEAQQVMMLEEAGKISEENTKHLDEQLRRQENLSKSQGLFTTALSGTQKALDKLGFGDLGKKLGLEAASKKAADLTYELTDGGKKALGVFGKMRVGIASFGAALKSALGPMALIGMAISLFGKFKEMGAQALEYQKEISQETANLTRELGLSAANGAKVAGQARAIGGAMGMTHEQATAAAGAIYGQIQGTEKLGAETMKTFMKLNVHGGISGEVLGKIYDISKLTGKEAGHVAEEIASQAQESLKSLKVNVSMKSVMESVSKVSSRVALNFQGSGKAITSAVVQAKKLGLEMEQVENIANSLLNIEDSIAAEMEAELLTGKDLNLEKAREAALNGDNAKLMEELANQGITAADYASMNRIQQDALAKSLGMSGDSLADMLSTQKKNEASNQDTLSLQKDSIAAMTSMASLAEAIKNEEDAKAASMGPIGDMYRQFESAMNKIATALMPIINTLFTELWNIVWPLFQGVEKWLTDSGNVKMMTEGIKSAFAGVKEFLTPIFEMLGKLAMDLVPVILVVWEKIKPVIMYVKNLIMEIVGSVGTLLNKLATGNGEFTTMEKTIAAIAIGLASVKAIMIAINTYKKIALAYDNTSKKIAAAKLSIEKFLEKEYVKQGIAMVKNAAIAAKDFIKATGSAIMKVVSSLATIPVVGVALGIAAAATVAGLAAKYMNDGVVSPTTGGGGYGDRVLYGPEGAISFNNKDTIVAGTNLFGNDVASGPEAPKAAGGGEGGSGAMIAELQRVSALLQQILSKEGVVMIDGNKVGTTLALSNYKQQ